MTKKVDEIEKIQSSENENEAQPESETSEIRLPDDPFDPSRLRLSQNFAESIGVKKALITVPVRKPDKQWFIRVHQDPEWRLETAILELKEDREIYLVDPSLWNELPSEIFPAVIFTAINRQGVPFLWPVRLPDPNGKLNEWHRSALEASQMGMNSWVRVQANMSLGAYEVFEATGELSEPVWPELGFKKLLEVAFKERFIRSLDHPVLRKLRGEI